MAVTDDVIAKCIEIESKVNFIMTLVSNATDSLWVAGDLSYTDFKAIADVQADAVAALVTELQALTEA